MISNIAQNLVPKNAAEVVLNLDADEQFGALVTRLGTGLIGTAGLGAAGTILGLHQHVDSANSANNKLFAAVVHSGQNKIYDVIAGSASLSGDTSGLKTRFHTFLGETLRLNGTDAPKAFNSTTWITTGGAFDLGDMPTGYKYSTDFLDRVYMTGNSSNPSRVVYSGLSDGSAVAWASDYIDIDAKDDDGPNTALAKVPGYLLVFKERSLHRFNYYSAFPESLVQIGTLSQESVVMGHGLCAFFSPSAEDGKGFYVTNGNRPVAISHDRLKNIKKFVDAIASSYYDDVSGWATDRGYAWSVGSLTVDDYTYTNAVLRWNRILDQWVIRTYPTQFSVFAKYVSSSQTIVVGGDSTGTVLQLDKPATFTDYNGKVINWMLKTHPDKFDYNQLKTISERIVLDCKNMDSAVIDIINEAGKIVSYRAKGNKVMKVIRQFMSLDMVKGNKFSVVVRGTVDGAQGILHEIEIPNIELALSYD